MQVRLDNKLTRLVKESANRNKRSGAKEVGNALEIYYGAVAQQEKESEPKIELPRHD